jgi:hypothetical protein
LKVDGLTVEFKVGSFSWKFLQSLAFPNVAVSVNEQAAICKFRPECVGSINCSSDGHERAIRQLAAIFAKIILNMRVRLDDERRKRERSRKL